eukprot:gb/GFBE01012486.1/.p1 GENE.gb/GFBE01012486.1/~~gb/GFBE01012486.1/.p1  ORF type:complete len:362 (+),score=54.93 gb/GFBE01012486.1/:1-1086(+)
MAGLGLGRTMPLEGVSGCLTFATPCREAGRQRQPGFSSGLLATQRPTSLLGEESAHRQRGRDFRPAAGVAASALTLALSSPKGRRRRQRLAARDSTETAPGKIPGTSSSLLLPNRTRSNVSLAALAYHSQACFKLDVSQFTSEEAKERHIGACGGPPEVEIVSKGQGNGVLAARGTLRVRYNARKIFENLCDPEENRRIFSNVSSVNFRKLIEEDKAAKTRLFEVSKTGLWTLLGLPFKFESTVLAVEDWRKYEIDFRLKKQGAMKHMSGFWRAVPVSPDETIVLFYNEAVPIVNVPSIFRTFAGRLIQEMAASLLEDLRKSVNRWQEEEAKAGHIPRAAEPGSDMPELPSEADEPSPATQ